MKQWDKAAVDVCIFILLEKTTTSYADPGQERIGHTDIDFGIAPDFWNSSSGIFFTPYCL